MNFLDIFDRGFWVKTIIENFEFIIASYGSVHLKLNKVFLE